MGVQNHNHQGPTDGRQPTAGSGDETATPDIRRFEGIDAPIDPREVAEAIRAGADGSDDGNAAVRAGLIRAAADGEIDPVEAGVSDADRAIAFERQLRGATARAMSAPAAPQALRASIEAQIRESRAVSSNAGLATGAAADAAAEADGPLADALSARAAETRDPSFWNAGRFAAVAAAAVLLMVVGALGWQLGALSNTGPGGTQIAGGIAGGGIAANQADSAQAGTISDANLAYRTSLARFVAGEHTRTLDDSYAERKYVYRAADDAADKIGSELQHKPTMPPCNGPTKFAGASPCGVPGDGPSAHMQFVLPAREAAEGEAPAEGRKVSVFVKQDKGELAIEEGTTYTVDAKACDVSDAYICVWRREGLLYTLVSEGRNKPICTKFLAQFGVEPPDPAHSL